MKNPNLNDFFEKKGEISKSDFSLYCAGLLRNNENLVFILSIIYEKKGTYASAIKKIKFKGSNISERVLLRGLKILESLSLIKEDLRFQNSNSKIYVITDLGNLTLKKLKDIRKGKNDG